MLDPGQLPEDARKALQAVPEFEPDKHIGKGANGEILLGYHRGIGKRVALKIYYFSEPKEAFDEPQLLCSVNHPNVLPVYDARQVDPHTAVVITQEADGGDLGDLIRSGCSLREAVRILIGVVSGIAALQSPGFSLVHRDLKPENILLGSGQPLIADFGSVKKIPEARGAVSGSKHSILYQPPEAFDPGEYYFNSDLYQAGVVGYELVGGDLPTDATAWLNRKQLREYRAKDDQFEKWAIVEAAMEQRICKGRLLRWDSLPGYVPRDLQRTLKKAVHVDSNQRLDSCGAFIAKLTAHLSNLPDWRRTGDGWQLMGWRGKDFELRSGSPVVVRKRTEGGIWRKEAKLTADTAHQALSYLAEQYGVPI